MTLFVHAFVTIFVVVDPIGSVPIFLVLTREHSKDQRRRAGFEATLVAALAIVVFAVAGRWVRSLLSISIEAIEIGGGVILGLAAFQLLSSNPRGDLTTQGDERVNIALVPLGDAALSGPWAR